MSRAVDALRGHLEPGDLLNVRQVLAILPVGRSTLYQLIDEGRLPAIRVRTAGSRRGRILIRRADLSAFVDKCGDTRPCAPTRVDVDKILSGMRDRKRGAG